MRENQPLQQAPRGNPQADPRTKVPVQLICCQDGAAPNPTAVCPKWGPQGSLLALHIQEQTQTVTHQGWLGTWALSLSPFPKREQAQLLSVLLHPAGTRTWRQGKQIIHDSLGGCAVLESKAAAVCKDQGQDFLS